MWGRIVAQKKQSMWLLQFVKLHQLYQAGSSKDHGSLIFMWHIALCSFLQKSDEAHTSVLPALCGWHNAFTFTFTLTEHPRKELNAYGLHRDKGTVFSLSTLLVKPRSEAQVGAQNALSPLLGFQISQPSWGCCWDRKPNYCVASASLNPFCAHSFIRLVKL